MTAPLAPAMPPAGAPDAGVGVWVGKLDVSRLDAAPGGDPLPLAHAEGYTRARLLVMAAGTPRGFVELPIAGGTSCCACAAGSVAVAARSCSAEIAPPAIGTSTKPRGVPAAMTSSRARV